MRTAIIAALSLLIAEPAFAQRVEIKEPTRRGHLQKMITVSGFECPEAVIAWDNGLTPYGEEFEAFCGEGHTVLEKLHYVIYPKRHLVRVCQGGVYSLCGD